jgi:S-methylmethionine-dependent homocysteine/selenocysteine methylase
MTAGDLAASDLVVTDGGLETWLLFDRGFDLPAFAAYPLVATPDGRRALQEYYSYYVAIAASHDAAVQLVGGCCGTDHRHVAALVQALFDARADR